ncbi:MAG: NIPSNAP family containing protein [Planctomycetes bacterium]|nr:NIPSNAP family containing protein [Planctomycetota bacterium]
MERREFLSKAGVVGLAAIGGGAAMGQNRIEKQPGESDVAYRTRLAQIRANETAARASVARGMGGGIDYYELRRYELETEEQKAGFDKFLSEAAIPALNRLGIKPVGVFCPVEGISPLYVLLVHASLHSYVTMAARLGEDQEFVSKGSEFLYAPAEKPAYKNLDIQLMQAFEGMPRLELPVGEPGRIFQLRTYESPSEVTGLKKIEMFNTAEIAIFRKVGLHPVFFGQTLAGTKMPNLTYMLGFKDMDESKANWKAFGGDPDWKKLSGMPEYADKAILRRNGITNLYLKPASYSQI